MWIILAFLTAFFTSLTDVFGKKIIDKVDVYIISWGVVFFSLPFLYAFLVLQGFPSLGPSFGAALAVSTVILVFALVLYFKAIKSSDLSITMPMLAFTPLLLLVTSPLILGEVPGLFGVIGILLIVGGSYVLHFQYRHEGYLGPLKQLIRVPGPRYMLMVALMFSIGANIDKIGVVNSSPLMWITMLYTGVAVALTFIMANRTRDLKSKIRSVWLVLGIMGFCNAVALVFQMTAITMTLVPYLIAVKRTSVVMSSLFGFLLFKERGVRERLIGALLMILGVFMISFYH